MDAAICVIDHAAHELVFAGAKRPLYQIKKDGELLEFKGSKIGIGDQLIEQNREFNDHAITYDPGDSFYMFSDGYPDQFGGPVQKKFMTRRLKKLILQNHTRPMKEIYQLLTHEMDQWMNGTEQTDDMLVIGFRL
jgi:serine phosphatase RsbU (regulator of sigma subunit)